MSKYSNIQVDAETGTATITVTSEIDVQILIPLTALESVSADDFKDQIDYLVSEAADGLVGMDLDVIVVPTWNEYGEEDGETDVSATIEAILY